MNPRSVRLAAARARLAQWYGSLAKFLKATLGDVVWTPPPWVAALRAREAALVARATPAPRGLRILGHPAPKRRQGPENRRRLEPQYRRDLALARRPRVRVRAHGGLACRSDVQRLAPTHGVRGAHGH